jgi:Signal transduction histidine kinase
VRLGLRPLRRIEQTAAAITAGDLSQRIDHPDPQTEVGRVGSALNTMLDRIEASDRRLRRFIADASHELRTPLTACGPTPSCSAAGRRLIPTISSGRWPESGARPSG